MTENEAREILTLNDEMKEKLPNLKEVYEVAINALEEIQQYRALGTVEDLKALRECCIPQYLGENPAIEYRYGRCKCGTVVKSYQKFCNNCGVQLDWGQFGRSEDK